MTETRLPAALAKRFRSGRACLDFLHTGGSGDWVEPELLRDRTALERWLAHVLGLAAVQAQDDDRAAAHRLRDALWLLARARTEGREFAVDDVETVNAFAAAAPPVPRLTADGTSAPVVATATDALSAIARDAIDLFTGPVGHRIRVCAAEDCAFLFVDASRPGSRRWCSMQRCGNLAKVRAHRATATTGE
jgi:predicted RNA-binding Zn ribbon-like protein